MPCRTFEAVPLSATTSASEAAQAVIEFTGLDLAGPSYEGRVFLNNPHAGPDTPLTAEQGYAGTFHVYGYGYGADETTPPAISARVPIRRQIAAPDAVRRAAAAGPTATVTLVAVTPGDEAGNETSDGGAARALAVSGVTIHAEDPHQ